MATNFLYVSSDLIAGKNWVHDTGGRQISAFDLETGTVIWQREKFSPYGNTFYTSPDTMYIIGTEEDNSFFSQPNVVFNYQKIDPKTGKELWSVKINTKRKVAHQDPLFDGAETPTSSIPYVDDQFVVAKQRTGVYLIDAKTGTVKGHMA